MDERTYKIDLFQSSDATGVAKLFTTVYGDGYPVKIVYHPDELILAFRRHEYIPVLARTIENEIVGYVALYRSTPNQGRYEIGIRPGQRKSWVL